MMNIISNKDAILYTDNYDVILVGTSIYCMLSNGFQNKLRHKYPFIEEANDSTNYGDKRKLGKRLTIGKKPIISLMYICNYPNKNREFIDYSALENALATANVEFKDKSVMCPLIGSSIFDGNGNRDKILKIFEDNTKLLNLDLYDYEQISKEIEIEDYVKNLRKLKNENPEKYLDDWKNRNEFLKKAYLI